MLPHTDAVPQTADTLPGQSYYPDTDGPVEIAVPNHILMKVYGHLKLEADWLDLLHLYLSLPLISFPQGFDVSTMYGRSGNILRYLYGPLSKLS